MPSLPNTGHKLAAGTLDVAGMGAVDPITSWAKVSDQFHDWLAPADQSVPETAVYIETLEGGVREHGYRRLDWQFSLWTPGQMEYLYDTFLASGVQTAPVTILTYDATEDAVYLNCILHRPTLAKGTLIRQDYLYDVILRFTGGVVIT